MTLGAHMRPYSYMYCAPHRDGCYNKADRAQGSDYARSVTVEPGAMETREEHARDIDYAQIGLVEKAGKIAGGH